MMKRSLVKKAVFAAIGAFCSITALANVAKIGETGYETLQKALTAAATTADVEVTLISDVGSEDAAASVVSIPEGFNGTLNLGGYTLYSRIEAPKAMVALTVKNGKILHRTGSAAAIDIKVSGLLTLDGVYLETSYHGVRLRKNAKGVINSGDYRLVATSRSTYNLLYLSDEPSSGDPASLVVNGGDFYSRYTDGPYVLIRAYIGEVTINDGVFHAYLPGETSQTHFVATETGRPIYINGGDYREFSKNKIFKGNESAVKKVYYKGGMFSFDPVADATAKLHLGQMVDGYTIGLLKDGNYIVSKAYAVGLTVDTAKASVDGLNEVHACGSIVSFTVAAVEGFKVTGVTLDGAALTPDENGKYTFTMPEKDVAIVVTTEAASIFDIMINGQPVADADALKDEAKAGTEMTVPVTSTWTAEGNVLKKDGEAYVEFADYYTVVVNGTTVTLKLNKPVIGDSTEGADDAFTVTAEEVTIKITNFNSALKYGVRSAADINSLSSAEITTVAPDAVGVITLEKFGDSAFYEVVVSDVDFPVAE